MRPDIDKCLQAHGELSDTALRFLGSVCDANPSYELWLHMGQKQLIPPGFPKSRKGIPAGMSNACNRLMRLPVSAFEIVNAAAGMVAANGFRVHVYGLDWEIDNKDPDTGHYLAGVTYGSLDSMTPSSAYSEEEDGQWHAALKLLSEIDKDERRG